MAEGEIRVTGIEYSCLMDALESDHKPVYAVLRVNIPITDQVRASFADFWCRVFRQQHWTLQSTQQRTWLPSVICDSGRRLMAKHAYSRMAKRWRK